MAPKDYSFFVYILASKSRQTYIGVTNALRTRVREHKAARPGSYAARYNITRLVYYERFEYVLNAIAREKELKDWNREKKVALITGTNPTWHDLSEDWPEVAPFYAEPVAEPTADSSASLRNDKLRGRE